MSSNGDTCLGEFQHTLSECLVCELVGVHGHSLVCVDTFVVLALVVAKDFFPWVVLYVEFSLFNSVCDPKNLISINCEHCCLMVLFAMPTAVVLSQTGFDPGWGTFLR